MKFLLINNKVVFVPKPKPEHKHYVATRKTENLTFGKLQYKEILRFSLSVVLQDSTLPKHFQAIALS